MNKLTKQQALEKIKELEKYIEEIKKVIVENIEIALEDICSIKKFTELEEDNIKTILEWLIRIQLEEVENRESIKLVHEKVFNCPTLSIQCNHDFKFSHTEEENKIGSVGATAGTMPPRLFDVVICSKCGEIRKSLKYLTN